MKKRLLTILIGLFAMSSFTFGQGRTVTGKILSEEDGTSLPGVNVLVKGTNIGTISDINGTFRIEVEGSDAVLQFSYVGFTTQEVPVGAQSTIDVSLAPDYTEISEVVIVGYGTQKKEALTGSIATVGSEKLEQLPSASFQDALQGNVAGLQVTASDGAPGAAINVRVRGIGSITAGNEPLYVIDGIPVTSGSIAQTDFDNDGRSSNVLASLNPNDIESLTVLKDAASTAIYGSRGANGVVLITTKSGSQGKAKIDFKSQVSVSDVAFNNLLEPLNREQYTELYLEGRVNAGTHTPEEAQALFDQQFPVDPATGEIANTNWLEEMTRRGVSHQYDLSASGGTDKISYFISGGYLNNEGIVKENKFERFSGRANLSAQLTDKLKISNNINLSYFTQRGITDGTAWEAPFYLAYLLAPTVPIFDEQGRYYGDHASFFMGGNNPVGQLYDNTRELEQTRIINNLSANYEIMEGLTFNSAWSFDILNVDEFIFENARYGDGRNIGGFGNEGRTDVINWLGTQTLQYGKTFNEKHNLDVLLGYEAQKVTEDGVENQAEGFSHPSLRTLSTAANPTLSNSYRTDYSFNSYFSRVNYDFDSKYFLSASLRRDGSSRFGPDVRWGTFWSVGGGYTISQESFMQGLTFIDNLKLRASYGVTGNASIGNFPWAGLYSFNREYDGSPGAAPSQVANPLLTWESQENFNVGVDFNMFGNRLSGNVEYFVRTSSDLILDNPLSYTTGFRDIQENVGDMQNTGVELALNGQIIRGPDFNLSLGANITFINNEITKLPSPIPDGTKRREEGRDFQEFWLFEWAGVDPANGDPLWYTDETKTETTSNINEASRFYDGESATPDFFGGANLSASYKSFSLNVQLNYQIGNYVYDGPGWVIHGDGRFTPRSTSSWAFNNRWKQPGDQALFPRFAWGNRSASNTQNSSRYLFQGDFIRVRTINFAYDLPNALVSKLKLRSVRTYINLNNFFTWVADDNLHFDPEQTINGVYNTTTPIPKTASFGINIGL